MSKKSKFDDLGLPEPNLPDKPKVIPFGLTYLDKSLLTVGGVPRGRITQVFGPEHSGKTFLATRLAAMALRTYPEESVVWIDTENSLDADWARQNQLDIDSDRFLYYKRTVAEEVIELVLKAIKPGVSLIVVDSVGNQIEKGFSEAINYELNKKGERVNAQQPGVIAKLMTGMTRTMCNLLTKHDVAIFATNQIREKIGVMYGNPETTPGGKNWAHNLTINMRVSKKTEIKDDAGELDALHFNISVQKNRLGFRRSTSDFGQPVVMYVKNGIEKSESMSLLDHAVNDGLIIAKGPWYHLANPETGEVIEKFQGRSALEDKVIGDNEFRKMLTKMVKDVRKSND